MEKIDVALNIYGKPWQTIVSIKSLLRYSSDYIDKIYFIVEDDIINKDIKWIINEINYDNIIYYTPKYSLKISPTDINKCITDSDYLYSLRYEYALKNTNKKYVLVIHNDVLFHSDIIIPFINNIKDGFGIGQIGQCWNCALFADNICNGDILNERNVSYNNILNSINRHPNLRSYSGKPFINESNFKILSECRLNEWCALIDTNKYQKFVIPNGYVRPMGGYFKIDIGDAWFEDMYKLRYKAVNYDIRNNMTHAYFSSNSNGNSSLTDIVKYNKEEELAKEFYNNFLKI
jgi:hypothetical protein